ncbi:uncharacterized protein E0L32_010970 [Thyridium curvatum]|uniref:Uncharacterized protein n=1 Tax=Thyridium curvatum TaxID=1093900 RepID=A0A507ADG9_9PEZI|nr:uncharacterized protein E0L32_010970 [Thyridium curvatum]TPX07075.1 hypothetical protein E0L32_010970 [Thyridium curvatum]
MCTQINNLFTCGHRGFRKFDNCPQFGKTCFGAGGKHRDDVIQDLCRDCKLRAHDARSSPARKDPWWEDDPWKHKRKG